MVGIIDLGAIAYDSRSPLYSVKIIQLQCYGDEVVKPLFLITFLQQDNVHPHLASISINHLEAVQIILLPRRPRSSVELVCYMMDRQI